MTDKQMQEPWKSSDTAHRPGGLPQDFIKHDVENEGDWSEWVNPYSEQYFMKCCDCGLVHEMQFKVAKYSEGDECEFVADADLQAVFRARRATPPAAPVQDSEAHYKGVIEGVQKLFDEKRAQPAPVQEPVAWKPEDYGYPKMYEPPAAPVQKPVAVTYKEVADTMNALWGGTLEQVQIAIEMQDKPLYTTPPAAQRPWIGLTDEEIQIAWDGVMDGAVFTRREVYKAIEAKLKERNV